MNRSDSDHVFTISPEMVAERLAVRAEAKRRIEEIDEWFRGLKVVVGEAVLARLLPPDHTESASASPTAFSHTSKVAPGHTSKVAWLLSVLSDAGRGLSVDALLELAKAEPAESRFTGDVAAFDYWLNSVAGRGKIRKKAGLFFTPSVWDKLSISDQNKGVDLKTAMLDSLRSLGGTARAGNIVSQARTIPEVVRSISPTSQYPYVLLSRMVTDGTLERSGRDYSFPKSGSAQSEQSSEPQQDFELHGEEPSG